MTCLLQGASHPPLTGKRATDLLENMRRFTIPGGTATTPGGTAAGTAMSGAAHLIHASSATRGGGGATSTKSAGSKGSQRRRAMKARKRAGKWTDSDRDLAEREMAVVIVERQKVRVKGRPGTRATIGGTAGRSPYVVSVV